MVTPAVWVNDLTRLYGSRAGIDGLTFEVAPGEIFGFLGPNGAGKTTAISILTTLLKPTRGEARVAGHDVMRDGASVRRMIGIVFQEPTLDYQLTARENLEFHAILYGLSGGVRGRRVAEALALVGLEERADDRVAHLSGGLRRRVEVARGLLHAPAVLFLDEPTIGLDPQSRRSIWERICSLRDEIGVTIFTTTHYLDEAEFCDRVAIIEEGRVVVVDSPAALKDKVGGDILTLAASDMESLHRYLSVRDLAPVRDGSRVLVEVEEGSSFLPQLFRDFPGEIVEASVRRPTLDDVFLKLTGRSI